MYLVMKVTKWESMEFECVNARLPFPVRFSRPEKEIGFCHVFAEYKDALEYAGDGNLVFAIREKNP